MRWYRWTVVTVGRQSGNRYPVSFIRFRHRYQVDRWCLKMNNSLNANDGGDVYFEAERIK